jgi:anti-sigma regulatory factor (Ser/Thr protein kinase)
MDANNRTRASCRLGPTSAAPATAREFVASRLRTWDVIDRFPDIELLVSELVTNAVRHAHSEVEVTIDLLDSECVRLEVRDRSERLPTVRPLESAREGGWGLHIVGRIAQRWGLEQQTGEKTIWCEIAPAT